MNVIKNIFEIMSQKGIKQQVLSDALNCDAAVISNLKNGKRELKVSELEIISRCLEVDIIDLFTYPKKYVEYSNSNEEPIEAVLQIKLRRDKRDQILKIVFGDNNLEILNK